MPPQQHHQETVQEAQVMALTAIKDEDVTRMKTKQCQVVRVKNVELTVEKKRSGKERE